jgi:AhpD family alkylhydroperoxidase
MVENALPEPGSHGWSVSTAVRGHRRAADASREGTFLRRDDSDRPATAAGRDRGPARFTFSFSEQSDMSSNAASAAEWYATWSSRMKAVKGAMPDAARGFGALYQGTMRDGAIGELEKEYVALGIGIALHCENCIRAHVEKCIKLGAKAPQVLEVAGVAIMMGGGPCYTYATVVVEALQALGALETEPQA